MEHDSRAIANQLIRRAHEAGRDITPMQAIKLVYYCHAWMLGLHHRPLLNEAVEAWPYGPMIPRLYHALRKYGGRPLRQRIDYHENGIRTTVPYDEPETRVLDQVSEKYGHLTGVQLSALTHAPGTPWHQTWTKRQRNCVIPDPVIEDHYAALLERAKCPTAAGCQPYSQGPSQM